LIYFSLLEFSKFEKVILFYFILFYKYITKMNSSVLDQLKKFIVDNNIVGTSAGVCIALSVKDGIQSMVGDIIIPSILILIRSLHIDFLRKYLPENRNSNLNIPEFIKQMITFVLVVIVSFLFVKIAFEYLLNIKSSSKTNEKKENVASFIRR